ncbi:MAG: Gfo/Idh/MocA family protein [Kiritimatiellia bacterium]
MTNRREFLKGAALSAGAGIAAGYAKGAGGGASGASGAPMRNFCCAPFRDVIRVGIVGCGARGTGAACRLPMVPGVEVSAVCDIRPECAERAAAAVAGKTGRRPAVFSGSAVEYRRLCELGTVDVVYNATSWNAHVPVAVCAMKSRKHVFIEVPGAMFVDECWELVETAEACRVHCMQLENCCYGEEELLALNLCKFGLLGELLHGEGGYIHDRRWQIFNDAQWERWRNRWNEKHAGNYYSTHGLGPICMDMGVNRGDRLDYLVSVDSHQAGYEAFARATLGADNPLRNERFAMADMNVTTIRTAKGRTIMLQHDVTSPRPYSRLNLIAGTKGVFRSYPRLDICIEGADEWPTAAARHAFDDRVAAEIRERYRHPLYQAAGEVAKKVGGHGGMDYLMDLRWAYCLRRGLPLDTDVYDLAAWCAVSELTERSARNRSRTTDIPDFTRGVWRTPCNSNLMEGTIEVSQLDFRHVEKAAGQLNV